jgi:hypothetical protein
MAQSLSTRIDELVSTPIPSIVGTPASDGLQLRRLSLDLRLTVPSASETEAFLADTRPDRWEQWVKLFMADPLHRERLVDWLDKTLMQRRPHQNVDRNQWIAFLRRAVDEDKPLDQLLREMVGGGTGRNVLSSDSFSTELAMPMRLLATSVASSLVEICNVLNATITRNGMIIFKSIITAC